MTNNKRFTLEPFGINFIIRDNGRELTAKQVVDLLNDNVQLNKEIKPLLADIRHELVSLSGLTAFDICADKTEKITCVWNKDLIILDFGYLIKKIDEELAE